MDINDILGNQSRIAQIMEAISPIRQQFRAGITNPDNLEGDVYDSFVKGYVFGYINNLIAYKGGGSIDTNPNAALEILNVMMGSVYTGEDEGINLFNECLADRRAPEGSESYINFHKGFLAGEADHSIVSNGSSVHKLTDYLRNLYG